MRRSAPRLAHTALATAVAVVGSLLPLAPRVQASGSTVHWVGTSGTPSGTGTSCASPGYVGASDESIRAAMTAATAGDEIRICTGRYLINTTLEVSKALTFTSSGTTLPILDGQDARRIMNITEAAVSVTVNGLQFHNGRVDGEGVNGGAINVHANAELAVTNSNFYKNISSGHHGGGIALIGNGGSQTGKLTIDRSTFYKNKAMDGGAVVVVGVTANSSTITNSTFVSNDASRDGGAINGSFGELSAFNSTFIDNTSSSGGATSWNTNITESLVAYSPTSTPGTYPCDTTSKTMTRNVSTNSSCLANGTSPATYESLKLGFLATWAGTIPTVPIAADSTANDAVPNADCPAVDQLGDSRGATACAAGAVEPRAISTTLTPSSTVGLLKGLQISTSPTFTSSGLTAPIVYEFASDVSSPISGATMSASTGQLSGTITSTYMESDFVVKATGNNNAIAFAKVTVNNCMSTPVNNTYIISQISQLEEFRIAACGQNMNVLLAADIAWNGLWQSNYGVGAGYGGTFDGDGHSITGLQITGSQNAFFKYTTGATIKDLNYEATTVGSYGSGSLVRWALTTTISGVHGRGSVSHPSGETDAGCIGGIAGEIQNSTIRDTSYDGTVDATNGNGSWVGGLVGCGYSTLTIERASFSGSVTGNSAVGGIAGWLEETTIRDASVSGSLTGSGQNVGSVVGEFDVGQSYAGNTLIERSWSSASIQGASDVGAVLGKGPSAALAATLWELGPTGVSTLTAIGTLTDNGGTQPSLTGTAAADMKKFSTFNSAAWSIVDGWEDPTTSTKVWGICNSSTRPFLLSRNKTNPCAQPQQPTPETPASPANPPAPTTPTASGSGNADNPKVQPGKTFVVIGGKEVPSSLTASGGTRMSGTFGGMRLVLDFGSSSSVSSSQVTINAGTPISFSMKGLRPGSRVVTTLFSTPTELGGFTVSADGTVNVSAKIPANIPAGSHRLRLSMVNKDGETVNVWVGITVAASVKTLPATGSSTANLVTSSVWLLLLGVFFSIAHRRRRTI